MNNLELRHGILADSDCLKEYVNKQKVEELEKIKAETQDLLISYGYLDMHTNNDIIEILDNHIAELKGENNEQG
jgi:hypothetical protein